MAMRGHSTIQGSTDVSTLYDSLPGYLPQPCADERHERLDTYVEDEGQVTGGWSRFRQYIVSLLKAWYGDAATPANDFGFGWLPRPDADYSQLPYFDRMAKGGVKGYFLFGQNPAGGGPNARLHRAGLRNLDWLVVVDWFEIESAVFWRDDPEGPPASEIKTEVFFLPAASSPEKEGSLTNTQRTLQWHDKALDPAAAQGEYIGVALIEPAAAEPLAEALEATWRRDTTLYYEDGFQELADRGGRVGIAAIGSVEWVEVDDHHDLARAREVACRC